jgi:hypothetical protein
MNKKLFKTIQKNKQFVNELRRAHFMIALLAIGIALLVSINSMAFFGVGAFLTVSLIVLSIVIAATSLAIVIGLSTKR